METQPTKTMPIPIIQSFFGKPVRFFKAEFEVEMHCRNSNASPMNFPLETWAISLPDYSRAINYGVEDIWRIIQRSKEVFEGFYRQETILDAIGRRQRTIIMAIEMCDMLTAKLHTSRIKDPATRAAVIQFQRWTIFVFGLIRRGRLRPVRFVQNKDIPTDYLSVLSLPPGSETRKAVLELAQKENVTEQQIYRRFQKLTGENMRTTKGRPKKCPSTKGNYRSRPEYQQIIDYRKDHSQALGAEIRRVLGLSVSASRINAWMRDAISVH